MTNIQKRLSQIIADLVGNDRFTRPEMDPLITGIALDSRETQPGNIFVALPGTQKDGHLFIEEAIQKGAVAVVGSKEINDISIPYLIVKDPRETLAKLASSFYDHPARKMTVIGVTGTDGKTTTTNLIYKILRAADFRVGMVSTVNAVIGDEEIDTGFHVTTPEAPMVQQLLASMVDHGITHVVLETTSHGLDQKRVAECDFDLAVYTNITHEHLDYHGTYENYLQSKAQLIREVAKTKAKKNGNPRKVVLNKDDISYAPLVGILEEMNFSDENQISYSCLSESDFFTTKISTSTQGIAFSIHNGNKEWMVQTSLLGSYNAANILAAFSACVGGLGIDPDTAVQGIACLTSVPGREEVISLGQDFTAIVDFAHTPNALKVALENARQMTKGRIIAVFGSAGLRDKAKRRMMAEVSIQMADLTILTAEDPRTEKLSDILNEMADSAQKMGGIPGNNFFCIPDRGEAILEGVNLARSGDLVIACGKGHEQSMCFGTTEYPWDDRTAMQAALSIKMGKPGPAMPILPTSKSFQK